MDSHQFELISSDFSKKVSGSFQEVLASNELPLLSFFLGHYWQNSWGGLRIETEAGSPPGAGLGGSSSLAIALSEALIALRQEYHNLSRPSETAMVETARDLEARIIRVPTGVQDYWGAIRGGINEIYFSPGETKVTTHNKGKSFSQIDEQLLLCYSGQSRASAINNWEIFKRVFDGDIQILESLQLIADCAQACSNSIRNEDSSAAFSASRREWSIRCKLWPGVETEVTKKIANAALSAGASLVRVCGAGGGGVMAIIAEKSLQPGVITSIQAAGGKILTAKVVTHGVKANWL